MTTEYSVIGEHKQDDGHLLVMGEDGQPYDYALTSETIEPVEIDDRWRIDEDADSDVEGVAAEGEPFD